MENREGANATGGKDEERASPSEGRTACVQVKIGKHDGIIRKGKKAGRARLARVVKGRSGRET